MLDEGNDLNIEPAGPPEGKGNRTFWIVGGIFGALIILTLLCGAVWILWLGPTLSSQTNATRAYILTQNAEVIGQMTSTAEAALWTPTTRPTNTVTLTSQAATRTNTPVVAQSSPTVTVTTTSLAAMQTQLSEQLTSTAIYNATHGIGGEGMPTTGFFDEFGRPGLIILTVMLIAVIFLARRLRKAPVK